jgi:glycosyltransferase involved in cell wall biosynthesis
LKVLLLNQCFYPDVVSTAQHLTDLATELAARGDDVTVIASDRGYDDPTVRFPRREIWKNIHIIRIPSLSLGKSSRWRRMLNFASFVIVCALRLLTIGRFDAVVALTSPPLISFLAALFVRLRGGSFCFWVMDLNPDEAIAAGWLNGASLTARVLQRMLNYSFKGAARIVVLDRFMKERVLRKGADPRRVSVIPPWSHDDAICFSREGREAFRTTHGLGDRFVVMYSGNHSPCHPLDTLLEAALTLKARQEIVFCFVGGGSEHAKVKQFAARHALSNIKCLPYQPLDELSGSLSAADLHVVVMGEAFAGIVHPCKIYNIVSMGARTLYIGPEPSHITDIASQDESEQFLLARHGDVDRVVTQILNASETTWSPETRKSTTEFSKQTLLPQLISAIGGNSFEDLFRPLPDSDNRLADHDAAYSAAVPAIQVTRRSH